MPGVGVAEGLRRRQRRRRTASGAAPRWRRPSNKRRGRLLHHLLVAPLDGALALEAVDEVAVAVAEDLHLDVAGRGEVALEVHALAPERGPSRGRRTGGTPSPAPRRPSPTAMPMPPPPPAALHKHRVADPLGLGDRGRAASGTTPVEPGTTGTPAACDEPARLGSCPSSAPSPPAAGRRRRARRRVHARANVAVLGEEAVARVDRLGAGLLRGVEHRGSTSR